MSQVILYTQSNCPPCEFAKAYLTNNDIEYVEKNITRDHKAKTEMMVKYNAFSTPVIVINEQPVIGFDQEQIEKLLASSQE